MRLVDGRGRSIGSYALEVVALPRSPPVLGIARVRGEELHDLRFVAAFGPGLRRVVHVGIAREMPEDRPKRLEIVAPLAAPTREAALDEIAEWTGAPRSSARVLLTREQLREFAVLPGLGLGAHTVTHPALPGCLTEDARAEIAGGVEWLRAQVAVEVEQFAYPFGEWNTSLARLVAELGFRAAYTTDGNAISWSSSPHALPRVPAEGHRPGDFARLLADLWGRRCQAGGR
jgi:Polysaccharide deacetylase